MEFLRALLALFLSMLSIFNIFEGPHEVPRPEGRKDFENIYYNGMKITDVNSGVFEYDSCATITIK